MTDLSRHLLVFDPVKFNGRVDVIGCGAVGSFIALQLAKLGARNIHLWDGDSVESHNVPNQFFKNSDIGLAKVDALAQSIKNDCVVDVTIHNKFVKNAEQFGDVVFLAVDSMSARKEIFNSSLRFALATKLVVDVRMGNGEFRVYGFNPTDAFLSERWLQTLVDDEETQESVCNAKITVIPTVMATASFAVHRFLVWYSNQYDDKEQPEQFEWIAIMNPFTAITQ